MNALQESQNDVELALQNGRYRLLEKIGDGGMSIVYRSWDVRLGRFLAIKILKPKLASQPHLRRRFEQEARAMAALQHNPHVVIVHDFGEDPIDQRMFIAMELMEAGSLQDRLSGHGSLPPRLAAEAIVAVLIALEAAHEKRYIHRDVKPSNVLVSRAGVVKVGDFGIARLLDNDKRITRPGQDPGTFIYMAPEQKRGGEDIDFRADLYSTGATLFALLTNQDPYDLDRPDAHSATMTLLPEALREIVHRATQYRPEDRYASAAEMRRALTAVLADLPPNPPGTVSLAEGHVQRWPTQPRVVEGSNRTIVPDPAPTPRGPVRLSTYPPRPPRPPVPFWAVALGAAAFTLAAAWLVNVLTAERPVARGAQNIARQIVEISKAAEIVTAPVPPVPHGPAAGAKDLVGGLESLLKGHMRLLTRLGPLPPLPPPPVGRASLFAMLKKDGGSKCDLKVDGKFLFTVGKVKYGKQNNISSGTHDIRCERAEGLTVTLDKTDFAPGEPYTWEVP